MLGFKGYFFRGSFQKFNIIFQTHRNTGPPRAFCDVSGQGKIELGEKLSGGDKSEAIFAARLLWGSFLPRGNNLPLSGHWV